MYIYIQYFTENNKILLIVMRQRMVTSVTIFYVMLVAKDTFFLLAPSFLTPMPCSVCRRQTSFADRICRLRKLQTTAGESEMEATP